MIFGPEKESLYRAIEACRPGSQDLANPELAWLADVLARDPALAARYRWVQVVDGQVASVFPEVPVPEGLEARILEKLADVSPTAHQENVPTMFALEEASGEAEPWTGPTSQEERLLSENRLLTGEMAETKNKSFRKNGKNDEDEPSPKIPSPQPVSLRPRAKSRRWVLAWGVVGAVAAACLLVVFWPGDVTPELSASQVQDEAIRFALSEPEDLFGSGVRWQEGQPLAGFLGFSGAIWVRGEIRVRRIAGLLGREGWACDLRSVEGIQATLYVVPLREGGAVRLTEDIPVAPPRYAQTARTGGFCAGAWQENGVLYLLVVHRDSSRAYYHFFRPQVVT